MTAADRTTGWCEAPASDTWTCPECGTTSPVDQWAERDSYCEDCGDHDGRECPACGEVFDSVWGAPRILEATTTTEGGEPVTDPTPWDLPYGYGGPSRYRAQPDWEVHTTHPGGRCHFVLRNTTTGHTEDLPSSSGLYHALDTAEMRIAGHLGTTEHLSSKVLELLDDTDRRPSDD